MDFTSGTGEYRCDIFYDSQLNGIICLRPLETLTHCNDDFFNEEWNGLVRHGELGHPVELAG